MFGTPIINPPQSAILGMHGIFDRPVAINGKVWLSTIFQLYPGGWQWTRQIYIDDYFPSILFKELIKSLNID
jgi:hypothetical protein